MSLNYARLRLVPALSPFSRCTAFILAQARLCCHVAHDWSIAYRHTTTTTRTPGDRSPKAARLSHRTQIFSDFRNACFKL
ncbi:hypothetical protein EI94DRAFT_1714201 [Lactarius quietus]|nr:hypothetical protein EI94DRAFT_1714201 [Lactarius quietus]